MKNILIIGLGKTGYSAARYFLKKNIPFSVNDSREAPPCLKNLQKVAPSVSMTLGTFDTTQISKAEQIVLTPGISLQDPAFKNVTAEIVNDIELFAREAKAPIIAITGSNGKTTVATLVAACLKNAGFHIQLGGNIGVPVLDLLDQPVPDFYVLELSSYQLEQVRSLKARAAVVLNITEDHMDYYHDFEVYAKAKWRIYDGCDTAVLNPECMDSEVMLQKPTSFLANSGDPGTLCVPTPKGRLKNVITFSANPPKEGQFGLAKHHDDMYLMFGDEPLIAVKELTLQGTHHYLNALATLALCYAAGGKAHLTQYLDTIKTFQGIAHRCQIVKTDEGITWINDSKGTNVGATLAALENVGEHTLGRVILIAGGQAKEADFAPLLPALKRYCSNVMAIGEAKAIFRDLFSEILPVTLCDSLEQAVERAQAIAEKGDSVLLSPACASFDMFAGYEDRGERFIHAVERL